MAAAMAALGIRVGGRVRLRRCCRGCYGGLFTFGHGCVPLRLSGLLGLGTGNGSSDSRLLGIRVGGGVRLGRAYRAIRNRFITLRAGSFLALARAMAAAMAAFLGSVSAAESG